MLSTWSATTPPSKAEQLGSLQLSPKTGSSLHKLRIWGRDFRQSRLVVVALNFFFRQQQRDGSKLLEN